ncbi:MAG: hypothetical protein AMXMBFR59_41060 [Rhodanobacteraceae bacterium]
MADSLQSMARTARKRPGKTIQARPTITPSADATPPLPLAVWTDLPTFAGAIEHWLQQDAFNEWQIAYLLDPRAVVVIRAKLAMLWAFCDERHSFSCDMEATRRAVTVFLQRKLDAIEDDKPRRAAALRKIVQQVRGHE